MKDEKKIPLLVRIAQLYYERNYTKKRIASEINRSRQTVSNLLKEARKKNIVEIRIKNPLPKCKELENEIKNLFDLIEVIVEPSSLTDERLVRKVIGQSCARYLENILKDGYNIGIGWGRTILETINAIKPKKPKKIQVTPLLGSLKQVDNAFQINNLVQNLSLAFGGQGIELHIPLSLDSEDIKNHILIDSSIREVINLWNILDVALVGIGSSPIENPIFLTNYLSKQDVSSLKKMKVVGDICTRFYDIHGQEYVTDINKRTISIDLKRLKMIPKVIAVAGGYSKVNSIIGALRGKFLNILITDEITAKSILKQV